MSDAKIRAYCAERDKVLAELDIDKLIEFKKKHNLRLCSNRQVEEIAMQKTITGVVTLPLEFRKQSYKWLADRGYHSLDDGELRG